MLIHFLRDVIVAVAVVVAYISQFFEWVREREVRLHHVVYEVWLVSYIFFLFQLWYSCTVYMRKWMFSSIGQTNIWEFHISTPHEFLTAANSCCGPTNESIVQKWINEIQSTPDKLNLQGKSKKKIQVIGSSSYQELEANSRK